MVVDVLRVVGDLCLVAGFLFIGIRADAAVGRNTQLRLLCLFDVISHRSSGRNDCNISHLLFLTFNQTVQVFSPLLWASGRLLRSRDGERRRCRLLCFGLPAWVQSSHFLSPLNPFLVDPVECFFIGNGRIEVIALVVSVFKQSFDRGVRSLDSCAGCCF